MAVPWQTHSLPCRNGTHLDAITACSDAFRISADLGGEMAYPEDKPPYLLRPLITAATDLRALGSPDPGDRRSRMDDRTLAVSQMVRAVGGQVAVLGWIDMPFAEACSACGVSNFMLMLKDDPGAAHRILEHLTGLVIQFALAQVRAGAGMIGAGDAAASLLSRRMYEVYALPYEQQVSRAIHDAGSLVKLHICGNTTHLLASMVASGADLFNVDHLVPLAQARAIYGAHDRCFKGNLDPVWRVMEATPEGCRASARECMATAAGARYMLSPGCEVRAETPDEVFRAFCGAPLD